MTQQQQLFQILHANLRAHIYNRRGPCHLQRRSSSGTRSVTCRSTQPAPRSAHPLAAMARASSHLKLPQQTAEHAAAAHGGCEQHAFNLVQRGATGRPTAAFTAEDPKRALVHALQNDLLRMSLLLEQLDELLSA